MATRNLSDGWTLRRTPRVTARRGGAAITPDIPPQFLQAEGVRVEEVLAAEPTDAARRRGTPPELAVEVDVRPGEEAILAIRHTSGALTFHPSVERAARTVRRGAGARGTGGVSRFRVPIRRGGQESIRRGLLSSAIKVVVLKVAKAAVDKAVSVALPKLVALWEARIWQSRKLQEGWFRVSPAPDGIQLTEGLPEPDQRSLLLVHGTFSNAASAYRDLARTDFFDRIKPIYGTRIFAYNHFSLSRTPDENAGMLLTDLPAGEYQFDAITHSRGGLVLRSLVEHRARHGSIADRFHLGRAVLVASPNDGTPLATPKRWEETVGWFGNLLELFPDNPFTTGAEFVSEAIVWLASHLAGDVPGLRSMDSAGELVADLQSPPGPPANAYSALVSNFHADDDILQRALDVGVDAFFATANDLVVPSEGGWRIDRDGSPYIPGTRIGCFGPGGNIDSAGSLEVTHLSFFGHAETSEFIARALAGQPQKVTAIDPDVPLPDRRFTRGARAGVAIAGARAAGAAEGPVAAPLAARPESVSALELADTFHIVIMDADSPMGARARRARRADGSQMSVPEGERPKYARVFASYAGARVTTWMQLRADRGEAPTRFGQIISVHERIKSYTNRVEGSLPADRELMDFGSDLFETLFQEDVRRLYDEARSRQRGRRLDLVLTSMIPWIAEKPWEFAYDTRRASFLATEEIHFVRNVLTAVPADIVPACAKPLRILIASAQPVGFGHLSIDQEVGVIRRGFDPLIEAGLVAVDVLPRATPDTIHGMLSTGDFQALHFIGHGVFDEEKQEGQLIFEDPRGGEFALGERSVREIFCKRGLSLVFLNSCQSGTGGRSEFNKGVAQALVSHGLPALVANQYSVLDASATTFAQHFYWSIAQGMSLAAAAREARIAVNYSLQGELIDWAVPVLYARDPNAALCTRSDRAQPVPMTSVRATSRRATAGRPIRVGVWDIDDVFPSLDRTLARMNAAQKEFGFELVDISAPLDAWDVEEKSPDGTPYLMAEKVVERLESKTVELRINLLVCVTRHWMRDEETVNIYVWWPTGHKPSVVLFSCAGFEGLEAEGPSTDRAIANAMVAALAGFYGELDSHKRGAKDCPLAYDQSRDIELLTGRQKFDASCRRKLAAKVGKQLPALEALLDVF